MARIPDVDIDRLKQEVALELGWSRRRVSN
jgi:hypothetical protein